MIYNAIVREYCISRKKKNREKSFLDLPYIYIYNHKKISYTFVAFGLRNQFKKIRLEKIDLKRLSSHFKKYIYSFSEKSIYLLVKPSNARGCFLQKILNCHYGLHVYS